MLKPPVPPKSPEEYTPLERENDVLLADVARQIADKTLDPNNQALFERLVNGFSDRRGTVRLRIAETLGSEIGQPTNRAVMAGLANHEDPLVRRACGKTLTLIADPESIPVLIHSLLNDEDTVVHGSCAGALARMGTPAVPALMEVLEQEDLSETTKGHLMWALAFNALEAKETFYRAYESGSDTVRSAMVGAIAKVAQDAPEERAFQLLMKGLDDTVEDVRCEAAAVLGNLSHKPAMPKLLAMLNHEAPLSRKAAALAIMKIDDGDAIASLQSAMEQESSDEVKSAMKLAISQLERKTATEEEDDGWD